ncbi:MAG: formylglycine-generating enzyme family protein [Candidatus Accumulibacter sp.]|nr:formylglycine-generating enzyme family protein [Accumulibacter sp.]
MALRRPRWASSIGRDAFGLFTEITMGKVSQRFRWIVPGRFLMGSPANEPERSDDEMQHPVTLSHGFWLADTACTQAFWLSVTGTNPSSFKFDNRNPVENVSEEDTQAFISQLNRALPGLQSRLPSEAEWEYACRAGTMTAFWFGNSITGHSVHYGGNSYADGTRGRPHTVPVGSLPPNPWGLYEMHGNVHEWCADWYGPYSPERQLNPRNPMSGSGRVLRGGSWSDFARFARSASRRGLEPTRRSGNIGFRLVLDQEEQALSSTQPTIARPRAAPPSSTLPPAGPDRGAAKEPSILDRLTSLFKRMK